MFGNAVFRRRDEGGGAAPGTPRGRPTARIGLALGGGAARGWTHIGVIRALEEAGLKPDVVAGTSIGAVVGGCYVAGVLDNLEAFARTLTRRRVFGLLDLNFVGSGLIAGGKLSRLLGARLGDRMIEDLPSRFVAIATELGSGHEVWLTRGHLIEAMRASYALPGVFQPVRVNGRWLVDGALVNPVPVSAARALGAELVIAINPQTDLFGRGTVIHDHSAEPIAEEVIAEVTGGGTEPARRVLRRRLIGGDGGPPGISAVMVEAFNIIQDRIARSRLAGDPPDFTIGPKVGGIGLFEFHRAAEAIDIGYEFGRRMAPEIADAVASLA